MTVAAGKSSDGEQAAQAAAAGSLQEHASGSGASPNGADPGVGGIGAVKQRSGVKGAALGRFLSRLRAENGLND